MSAAVHLSLMWLIWFINYAALKKTFPWSIIFFSHHNPNKQIVDVTRHCALPAALFHSRHSGRFVCNVSCKQTYELILTAVNTWRVSDCSLCCVTDVSRRPSVPNETEKCNQVSVTGGLSARRGQDFDVFLTDGQDGGCDLNMQSCDCRSCLSLSWLTLVLQANHRHCAAGEFDRCRCSGALC